MLEPGSVFTGGSGERQQVGLSLCLKFVFRVILNTDAFEKIDSFVQALLFVAIRQMKTTE